MVQNRRNGIREYLEKLGEKQYPSRKRKFSSIAVSADVKSQRKKSQLIVLILLAVWIGWKVFENRSQLKLCKCCCTKYLGPVIRPQSCK